MGDDDISLVLKFKGQTHSLQKEKTSPTSETSLTSDDSFSGSEASYNGSNANVGHFKINFHNLYDNLTT